MFVANINIQKPLIHQKRLGLQMTVFVRLGVAEISTPWPFRYPLLVKMSISIASSPQTIRDWNDLPEFLISSSELSDDSVSKFTSLVRARD